MGGRDELTTSVRAMEDDLDVCEAGEQHLLAQAYREALAALAVPTSAEVGVALMAAAVLLARCTDEWGGDARDALRRLALVGLDVLEGPDSSGRRAPS